MKIAVLNGSPKGKYSITLQTVLYLEKLFPNCQFKIIQVGQQIKRLEKDLQEALNILEDADLILFAYPVYTFIAPSQLHRFIELIKEAKPKLKGKFATQITTSKHFFDITAHKYIEENCHDLGLKVIKGLSADMEDLLSEQGRQDAEKFWHYVLFSVEKDIYESAAVVSSFAKKQYLPSLPSTEKQEGFDTVILTSCKQEDSSLKGMIEDFTRVYPYKTRVINIEDYPFAGGCLGCFNCAADGKCIYKDGFDEFLRNDIQRAASIVYAFTIKDHSMGASFKVYDDRQFCNGHRTVTMGMPMGYIVNGDYQREANLQNIIEGRCQVGHNFLAGVATDARGIEMLSQSLVYALNNKLVLPQNFLGVGGMKIFRDLIYLMRGLMKEDHRFYKKHGIYDFPQKRWGTIIKMQLVGVLMNNPSLKRKMGNKMNEGMISPYKKVIQAVSSEEQ